MEQGLLSLRIESQAKAGASVLDESDWFWSKGTFDGLSLELHYRSSRAPGMGFTWQHTQVPLALMPSYVALFQFLLSP